MERWVFTVLLKLFPVGFCFFQTTSGFNASNHDLQQQLVAVQLTAPVTQPTSFSITAPFDVLFATNEDCDLYINGELKGTVLKSDFFYTKLEAGTYTYKAKSKTTADELQESFTVGEKNTNEVFMDLLYIVDQNNLQRQQQKANTSTVVVPPKTQPIEKKPVINKPVENKPQPTEDAKTQTVSALAANMVEVRGGNFTMGNNKSLMPDEEEHLVSVSNIFFSRYEVTQEQWQSVMGTNPSINRNCPTCPVENVSWEEVIRFIRRLNGLTPAKFRLPTEAEWEYVAKIGGKPEVDSAGGQDNYIKKAAWYFSNSEGKSHTVGARQPNVLGIYDLMGNVSEWCLDWYGAKYYKEETNALNPEGPPLGKEKIIRGGNYKEYVGDRFRPSFRNRRPPVDKSETIGFRLVMEKRN